MLYAHADGHTYDGSFAINLHYSGQCYDAERYIKQSAKTLYLVITSNLALTITTLSPPWDLATTVGSLKETLI